MQNLRSFQVTIQKLGNNESTWRASVLQASSIYRADHRLDGTTSVALTHDQYEQAISLCGKPVNLNPRGTASPKKDISMPPLEKPIKGEYNSQSQPVPSEEDYRTVDSTEVIEIEFSDDNVSMTDDPDIGPFASLALIQEIDYESQQGAESDIHNMSEAYGTISMTI
jgi:hypothetical protein